MSAGEPELVADEQPEPAVSEAFLTLTEAERVSTVSRRTLSRMAQNDELPGAHRDPSGRWLVPPTALLAAGLMPVSRESRAGSAAGVPAGRTGQDSADAAAELDELRAELTSVRHLLELAIERRDSADRARQDAEKLAAERGWMLRQLTGSYPGELEPESSKREPELVAEPAVSAPSPRRRWLRRR